MEGFGIQGGANVRFWDSRGGKRKVLGFKGGGQT